MVDELHEAVRDLQVPVFLHGLFQPSQVVCDIAVFVGLVVMIVDVVRDEVGIAGVRFCFGNIRQFHLFHQ